MRSLVSPALVAILVAGMGTIGCGDDASRAAAVAKGGRGGGGGERGKGGEEAREVRVAKAESAALPDTVTVAGTLAAEEEVVLGSKVAGRLAAVPVDLGSRVTKGQVLARLAPIDFELRVQQATAALEQAQARLGLQPGESDAAVDSEQTAVVRRASAQRVEAKAKRDRARTLAESGLVPQADLDAAEAAYQVADSQYQDAKEEVLNRRGVLAQRRSELELARQQLAETVIVAPFSGAVRERLAVPGQYVAAGEPVVALVRTHPLRLRLAVPERAAAKIRLGQDVRVTVDGDSATYPGKVARVSPAIEQRDRTLRLEAEVPNESGALRPGTFAEAHIVTAADRPVVLVPASSIVTFAGIEKVIAVEDGKAVEKRVRTGRRDAQRVEILEGVEAGDPVVVAPGNLVGGTPVTVVP